MRKENSSLKENVHDLTKIAHKFTLGKKNFDMRISEQKCIFEKQGLGFKPIMKKNILKNHFIKASNSCHIRCHYCNTHGHTSIDCHIRKGMHIGTKTRWIPKSSRTNTHGPKLVWVLKYKT